jgi:hypothetical protein
MKSFIFYTAEGYTKCPTVTTKPCDEHEDLDEQPSSCDDCVRNEGEEEDCENCQILGHGNGENPEEAWDDCLKANPWIRQMGFGKEDVFAYETVGEQITIR